MKKIFPIFILCLSIFLFNINCEEGIDADKLDPEKVVELNGQVINSETSSPVANAVVILLDFTPEQSTITDANGDFTFEFEVEETTNLELVAFRESFVPDTIAVLAVPGRTINDLELKLGTTETTAVPSGEAASIILGGLSIASIGVHESGSPEVAEISFEVQDSMGAAIDADHSVTVNFFLGSSPGGGEFLHPSSIETNSSGQASTSIFSGISAGVVQIIAEVDQGGGEILRSKPVAVAIHGGLPDSVHFSVAVNLLNFPGYNIYGLTDGITAYVGDKYGNPVKPNTAVYYTTTGGIIGGSALTDVMGRAGVDLMSAAPKPYHPVYGAGFATVTARTADEDKNTIESDIIVLFSGIPQISVNPTSINVPDKGSQSFSFTVSDQNGNPLAGGTNISVSVQSGNVEAVGNTDVSLPDTQSPFWTHFGFSLIDTTPDTSLINAVNVKISTSGPNGNLEALLSGVAR